MATGAQIRGTPRVLQNDARVAEVHHFTCAFVDYFLDAAVNSKGLATETDHLSVKRQPAIPVVFVQRFDDLIMRLHSHIFANFEVKNFRWCGGQRAFFARPGWSVSRFLDEIISGNPKSVADSARNNHSVDGQESYSYHTGDRDFVRRHITPVLTKVPRRQRCCVLRETGGLTGIHWGVACIGIRCRVLCNSRFCSIELLARIAYRFRTVAAVFDSLKPRLPPEIQTGCLTATVSRSVTSLPWQVNCVRKSSPTGLSRGVAGFVGARVNGEDLPAGIEHFRHEWHCVQGAGVIQRLENRLRAFYSNAFAGAQLQGFSGCLGQSRNFS